MPDGTILIHAIPGAGFDPFLQRVTASLHTHPLQTWMILPTHRLIRTVGKRFINSKTPFLPDHICTLDQFCEFLVARYGKTITPIKPSAARIILADVMNENEKQLSLFFAQRAPSAKTLQDLQTLISVIIRREIAYPDCLKELQTQKSEQIHRIITAYKTRLVEQNLVDRDTLLEWTVNFLQNIQTGQGNAIHRNVFIYGLFEPMQLEKQVITTILTTCDHGEYLIARGKDHKIFADTGEWLSPTSEEEITTPETRIERTAIFSAVRSGDIPLTLPEISLTVCTDPADEMRQIAEEIIRLHNRNIPYDDITIAFPDLRYALAYADQIFPDYEIPYISSSGPLLTRAPLTSYFMQILEFVEKGLRYDDLIQLVQSPFLKFWWTSGKGSNSEEEGDGKRFRLSYKNLDIICRTYGISSGFVDWEWQTDRITGMITGTGTDEISAPDSESQSDNSGSPDRTGPTKPVKQKKGYEPERPLPIIDIMRTLEGVRELMTIFGKMSGKRSIREHIQIFIDVLTETGSPVPNQKPLRISANRSLSGDETQILKQFSTILDELYNLARSGTITGGYPDKPVPVARFIGTLRLLVQDTAVDPDPDMQGVLLTGIRETAHQQYPFLFLASLNEGLIPRLSTRLPFTNGSENNRMETRTLADILRQERYQFIAALLAGSSHTYLSYHQHRDERTTLSSPFLDPLMKNYALPGWGTGRKEMEDAEEDVFRSERCSHSLASRRAGECIRERRWDDALSFLDEEEDIPSILHRISVERNFRFRLNRSEYDGIIEDAPNIRERLARKFGPAHRWSASMFESYARCPFRYYLERVIRIKPLEDLGTDLTPMAKGSLIHTVLCRFTRQMEDQGRMPLQNSSYIDAVTAINTIAEEEFEKVPYQTALWSAKKRQLIGGGDIGTGIFEKFVSAEIERLTPDEDGRTPALFTPRFFEYSFGAVPGPDDDPQSKHDPIDLAEIAREIKARKKEGTDNDDSEDGEHGHEQEYTEPVLFSGKIDRIDITGDGRFGIVDYKTGIKVPSTTEITKMKALQLPLYIHAFEKISGHTGVYGSYCQIQRTISHAISLYDPGQKNTLPFGKLPRSEPDWTGIMNQAVLDACSHVSRIHTGVFPIQPCTSCNADWFCPYGSICRFQPDRGSRLCEWIQYPPLDKDDFGSDRPCNRICRPGEVQ